MNRKERYEEAYRICLEKGNTFMAKNIKAELDKIPKEDFKDSPTTDDKED
jgi:hypothetical protein|tara:strand:- start:383 stop:532 length:150 start_codon:yes stop_codon:yes gene_type:complete